MWRFRDLGSKSGQGHTQDRPQNGVEGTAPQKSVDLKCLDILGLVSSFWRSVSVGPWESYVFSLFLLHVEKQAYNPTQKCSVLK